MKNVFSKLMLAGLALAIVTGQTGAAKAASGDRYQVSFQPWGNRDVIFRDQNGNALGELSDTDRLTIEIDGDTHDAAITPQGIDIKTLLSQLPMVTTPAGTVLPIELPEAVTTTNGQYFPPGTRVYADLNDFTVYRSVQPSSSEGGNQAQNDRFNDVLQEQGVTQETRPTVPPRSSTDDRVPLDPEIQDRSERETVPQDVLDADIGPVPQAFMSSPLCDCKKAGKNACGYNNSQNYGAKRPGRIHKGQDMNSGYGTKVVAAAYGCVTEAGRKGGYGKAIVLNHGNGVKTLYGHLRKINPKVKPGYCFKRGEEIGETGDTGNPGQPHLHFEVRKNGHAVRPRPYISNQDRASFNRECSAQRELVQDHYASIDASLKAMLNGTYASQRRAQSRGTVN